MSVDVSNHEHSDGPVSQLIEEFAREIVDVGGQVCAEWGELPCTNVDRAGSDEFDQALSRHHVGGFLCGEEGAPIATRAR